MGVVRACGTREHGGIYLEVPLADEGQTVDYFLIDPPRFLNEEMIRAMGISPIGVNVFPLRDPQTGEVVNHVIDWIGSEHYPSPQDWIEEVARFGISRRISSTFPFHLLGPKSSLFVVHAKAYIHNYADHYAIADLSCPRKTPEHLIVPSTKVTTCCVSLYKRTTSPKIGDTDNDGASFTRAFPSFSYRLQYPPVDVKTKFGPAIFGRFPIVRLAVITAPDGKHIDSMERAVKSDLPVELEDE